MQHVFKMDKGICREYIKTYKWVIPNITLFEKKYDLKNHRYENLLGWKAMNWKWSKAAAYFYA